MDRIRLPILVTLTLCGCIGVTRHTGSLPVAGEPASGWTIEPGATLATGAILATSGARIQLKVSNGNISNAKGISFSPWSPVGFAPMNTNEWESPAPHFVVTVSIVENDAGLSIDPANIRVAIDMDGSGVPESIGPSGYSPVGKYERGWCQGEAVQTCGPADSHCLFTSCKLPTGAKGCLHTPVWLNQPPEKLAGALSCMLITFPIPPPNPRYEFSVSIGELRGRDGAITAPTVTFHSVEE